MPQIKEIPITEMPGISIGHAQDEAAKTGVTALYFTGGACVGCDISGGGPASRETPLAHPLTADNPINAILFSGGSAFGLAASDGAMRFLEEKGVGYPTGPANVPLVCQSCIYDLGYGSAAVRPDAAMGYEACRRAYEDFDARRGNIGAGIGATVGKLYGMGQAMKSGFGTYAVQAGELKLAAAVVVNALGDVTDPADGTRMAGLLSKDRSRPLDTLEEMCRFFKPRDRFAGNTTIGAVITNAKFTKSGMNKIASMSRGALARCIRPVGTMGDGDSVYAASVGELAADISVVGSLGSFVLERAIVEAVCESAVSEAEYLKNI